MFIILHAFIKRGGPIDQAQIDVANKRWRLEAGYHQPSLGTLRKFGEISGRRLVVGYEDQAGHQELVGI